MQRLRRRPTYYSVSVLPDGTVLAARPIRKPHARIRKERGLRIDDDGVAIEFRGNGPAISSDPGRFRFQDRVTDSLNTRRAIRALVLPAVAEVQAEVTALRGEVEKLQLLLIEMGKRWYRSA